VVDSPRDLELAFATEPIVGWRVWRIERGVDRKVSAFELATELLEAERRGEPRPVEQLFRYRLRSLTQPETWPAGRAFLSACTLAETQAHEPPHASCECGVWALRSRESAVRVALAYRHSGTAIALGGVSLWGRILELERGWRAQYAYPISLALFGGNDEIARDVGEAYRVEAGVEPWPPGEPGANVT
jgi:hypothetical protein